jgi:flagellar hook-associated protein 3 FlgL
MRITENMKFNSSLNGLFDVQNQYNSLLEKMASQKRINRASDDPVGVTRVIDIKAQQASITQFRSNVDRCDAWASMTESKLTSANDLITRAKELATSQATATASADTRQIAAKEIKGIMEEMTSLANSQFEDRYLFAGSGTEEPFSASEMAATISAAKSSPDTKFTGTVSSGGAYTGDRNKTYVVKATSGGALAAAKYAVSSDGGKTWGMEQTGMAATIIVGDGVTMDFTGGAATMAENDLFYINGTAAGYYKGNGDSLSMRIGRSLKLDYNISGESIFTSQGEGGVDIFKTLNDLKAAMESNDPSGISAQLGNLDIAQSNINLNTAQCGTKANRIEIAKSNMDELEQRLTTSLSNTEDADVAELATLFAMKEVALKASYAMAAKIGDNTILDYIT